MEQKKKWTIDKVGTIALVAVNILYGILLVYLHYNQILFEVGGPFEADTPYHIKIL